VIAWAGPGSWLLGTGPQLPEPERSPDAAVAEARSVLAEPPYRPSWLERQFDAIGEWLSARLRDVLEWFTDRLPSGDGGGVTGGGAGGGGAVGWILVAGLVVALAAVLVRAWLTRGQRTRRRRRDDDVTLTVAEARRPATGWLADAAAHEAAGRWKDALRCRYRALVAELHQRGALTEIPGRTTGEERRELADRLPEAVADFDPALTVFERAWYAAAPVAAADVADFAERAERVLARAQPRRTADRSGTTELIDAGGRTS
jgi:hypothetical protein